MLVPERDAVFHHLARYLFHPTNRVWGLVTRYYRAYLARAELRLGVHARSAAPPARSGADAAENSGAAAVVRRRAAAARGA